METEQPGLKKKEEADCGNQFIFDVSLKKRMEPLRVLAFFKSGDSARPKVAKLHGSLATFAFCYFPREAIFPR